MKVTNPRQRYQDYLDSGLLGRQRHLRRLASLFGAPSATVKSTDEFKFNPTKPATDERDDERDSYLHLTG